MRTLLQLIACLLAFSAATLSAASEDNQNRFSEEILTDIRQLKKDVKSATNDVDILRRDQINYRLEKDILKEVYASHLQTLNAAMTLIIIVASVFGGLYGYLGFKNISEIKAKYKSELKYLIKLRIEFENDISTLNKNQENFETRLKVLELIEKIEKYINSKQWNHALTLINIALPYDEKNINLLNEKSICLWNTGKSDMAIETCKTILKIDPENIETIGILLEYLALSNKNKEFEEIYSQNKTVVEQEYGSNLYVYLRVLLALTSNDLKVAIEQLSNFVNSLQEEGKPSLELWAFDEAETTISKLTDVKQKNFMFDTIKFFKGQTSLNDFKTFLLKQREFT